MNMFRVLTSVFLLFTLLASATSAGEKKGGLLEQKIASLLPSNAKWALSVVDMESGTETINIGNSVDEAMAPGSIMKLFITGAVLDYAGGDGKIDMNTSVQYNGTISGDTLKGSLYLVGKGNALLSTKDLKNAVDAIQKSGIKRIAGDIVADDMLFDAKGLERTRKGPAYAPTGALGLDLHTVSITVIPSEAGKSPLVQVEPRNENVRFAVSARTVSGAPNTVKIVQADDVSYRVTGNIPAGSGAIKRRFLLNDPALYSAGAFMTLLRERGIEVNGDVKKGKTPDDAKVITVMNPPAFDDLVRDMNVNSLNVVADNLLLLLAEEKFGLQGTVDKGIRAIEEFLTGFEGSRGQEAKVFDGSGLDGRNRVTAGFTATYLYKSSKRPWFERFKNSLPKGGDGRLREIGIDDSRFSVKTGMLEDAYGLAGYGVDGKGREIAFSYIVNMPGTDVLAVNKHGGEIVRMIAGMQ